MHFEGAGGREVGSRFTTTRRIGPNERTMTQEITEVEPPHRFAAHGVEGPIRPHTSIDVEPLDDGARSRVTFELDFEGVRRTGRNCTKCRPKHSVNCWHTPRGLRP